MIGRREFLAGAIGTLAAGRLHAAGCELTSGDQPGRVLAMGVYAAFEPGEKWVQISPEIAVDSSRFGNGLRCLRMTSKNGGAAGAECALGAPSARLLEADVYVEDPASCDRMEFLLTSNGTGWIAKVTKNPTLITGWNRLQFSVHDCFIQGTGMTLDDWDKITKIRLYFMSKPGTTATIWIGSIRWLRTRAAITFTFDDGRRGCPENALPILATHGWAATIYVVTDGVGKRKFKLGDEGDLPDPVTLDQLHSLQDAGWDVSSHSVTHSDMTRLTSAQKEYELRASHEWLLKNGFERGARFFATPYGKRDAETQQIAAKVYENLRDAGISIGFETPGNMNWAVNTRYALRTQTVQSLDRTTLPSFASWVDKAILSGTWLILVCHTVDGPDGWFTPDLFRRYLNHLDRKRDQIDVVTMSQYWDNRNCGTRELSKNIGPSVMR